MTVREVGHYPRLTTNPRILGGVPIVRGTRLPVRAIAFLWRETGERARILEDYPHLALADVDDAIRYYEDHRAEVDADILDNLGRDE